MHTGATALEKVLMKCMLCSTADSSAESRRGPSRAVLHVPCCCLIIPLTFPATHVPLQHAGPGAGGAQESLQCLVRNLSHTRLLEGGLSNKRKQQTNGKQEPHRKEQLSGRGGAPAPPVYLDAPAQPLGALPPLALKGSQLRLAAVHFGALAEAARARSAHIGVGHTHEQTGHPIALALLDNLHASPS